MVECEFLHVRHIFSADFVFCVDVVIAISAPAAAEMLIARKCASFPPCPRRSPAPRNQSWNLMILVFLPHGIGSLYRSMNTRPISRSHSLPRSFTHIWKTHTFAPKQYVKMLLYIAIQEYCCIKIPLLFFFFFYSKGASILPSPFISLINHLCCQSSQGE